MRRIREAGDIVDVVIITPEPGRAKEIGQKLLAMAANPRDVQWVTWPSAGFSIPLELFVTFTALDGKDGNYVEVGVDEEKLAAATDGAADATVHQPRRRGRPRKQDESTDDTTTSPEEE